MSPAFRPPIDTRSWLIAADILAVLAGVLLVLALRRPLGIDLAMSDQAVLSHLLLLLTYSLLLVPKLGLSGEYEPERRYARIADTLTVVQTTFVAASVAVFLSLLTKGYLTGYTDYSRLFVGYGVGVPAGLLIAMRFLGHRLQNRAFAAGRYLGTSLIVGQGTRSQQLIERLAANNWLGKLGIESVADPRPEADPVAFERDLVAELEELRPTEVILALDTPRSDIQVTVVRECAFRGIAVRVLPGVFESYQSSYFQYGGLPVSTVFETPERRFARRVKAISDRVLAGLGLLLALPVIGFFAAMIVLTDKGPVFYRQERVGLHGRRLSLFKLRSMRTDAESALEEHLAEDPSAAMEWAAYQKLDDDPRITRVGRFIRKWSIDELPQLFNVVLGDLALVGPRPVTEEELGRYGARFVFSQVRPGITGLWQVSGRNDLDYQARIELDAYYAENWSLRLDLLLLLKTVRVVLSGSGR